MKTFAFESEVYLSKPLEEVFSFFSDAHNLEVLTPPWVHFQILTPRPILMAVGTRINYKIRVRGLSLRWRTHIVCWDPPHRFTDRQERGPYRKWIHEHTFVATADGTLCRDRVEYAVWGGSLIQRFWVGPDVNRIFEYRRAKMVELFGAFSPAS